MANRIGRNFIILTVGQLAGRGVAFLTVVHLTRTLLDEGFGIIAFATSVLTYAELVVNFGFEALGPREVARGVTPVQKLVGQVVVVRLLLLLPALVGLGLFVLLADLTAITGLVILLYGLSLLGTALDLNWVFLGDERMQPAAIAEVICLTLVGIGVWLVVKTPAQVLLVPIIYLVARLLSVGGLIVVFIRTYGRISIKNYRSGLRPLLAAAVPLAGSRVVSTTLANFDLIMIGLLLTVEAVGQYGAAYRVVWMPIMIVQVYFISLRPTVARAFVSGIEPLMPLLFRSTRLVTALGVGIAAGGIILAEPLIVFLFTDIYLPAVRPLQILLGAFLLQALYSHYRLLLISFDYQGTVFRIMALAAALNVILNFMLIGSIGIVGSALATLAANLVVLLLCYLSVRQLIRPVPLGRFLIRPLLCAIFMVAVLYLSASWHVILRFIVGGTTYLITLIVFKVVSLTEAVELLQVMSPRSTLKQSKSD